MAMHHAMWAMAVRGSPFELNTGRSIKKLTRHCSNRLLVAYVMYYPLQPRHTMLRIQNWVPACSAAANPDTQLIGEQIKTQITKGTHF